MSSIPDFPDIHFQYLPGYLEAEQNGTVDEWDRQRRAALAAAAENDARIASIAKDVRGHLEADARVREEERLKKLQR